MHNHFHSNSDNECNQKSLYELSYVQSFSMQFHKSTKRYMQVSRNIYGTKHQSIKYVHQTYHHIQTHILLVSHG